MTLLTSSDVNNKIINKKEQQSFMTFFCSYTPEEIIMASGFQPKRVIPLGSDPSLANSFLDSNFCPYVRSILTWAINLKQDKAMLPTVLVNSCDGMRRLHDVWNYYLKNSFVYFLDLPRKQEPASKEQFKLSLYRLKESLEEFTGKKITEEKLAVAIQQNNEFRTLLEKLDQLRQNQTIVFSSYDFLKLIPEGIQSSKRDYNHYLDNYIVELLKKATKRDQRRKKTKLPHLLLTGTVLDNLELIKTIEEYGGFIDIADHCNGWRYYVNKIDEQEPDKMEAIAKFYLEKTACPRMLASEEREERLLEIIKARNIDGVIFYNQKFCDPSLFQIPLLREKIKLMGIPSLFLEGDFSLDISGQVKTRIQAFLEAIEFG